LLENLHLVIDWLPKLESIVNKLESMESTPSFRLWLSSVSAPDFLQNLL